MPDPKTYYEILGVKPDATLGEIRTVYKRLALQYHPDKNVDKKRWAEEMFKPIDEAYKTLSDQEKRAAYDASLSGITERIVEQFTEFGENAHKNLQYLEQIKVLQDKYVSEAKNALKERRLKDAKKAWDNVDLCQKNAKTALADLETIARSQQDLAKQMDEHDKGQAKQLFGYLVQATSRLKEEKQKFTKQSDSFSKDKKAFERAEAGRKAQEKLDETERQAAANAQSLKEKEDAEAKAVKALMKTPAFPLGGAAKVITSAASSNLSVPSTPKQSLGAKIKRFFGFGKRGNSR